MDFHCNEQIKQNIKHKRECGKVELGKGRKPPPVRGTKRRGGTPRVLGSKSSTEPQTEICQSGELELLRRAPSRGGDEAENEGRRTLVG